MRSLTASDLEAACEGEDQHLSHFQRWFPAGAKTKAEVVGLAETLAEETDWDWVAFCVLGDGAQFALRQSPLTVEYLHLASPLWERYERRKDRLLAEYQRQESPDWAEYDRRESLLWVDYQHHLSPVNADYKRQQARLFASLWWEENNA